MPINLFIKGKRTLGMDRKTPMVVPMLAPTTTSSIRNNLLFHISRRLSLLDSWDRSSMETPLNLASTIPANQPAARRGCIEVIGATRNAVMAEGIFDPASNDPRNARPPVSRTKYRSPPWMLIPFRRAAANIMMNDAGRANKIILVNVIFGFFNSKSW